MPASSAARPIQHPSRASITNQVALAEAADGQVRRLADRAQALGDRCMRAPMRAAAAAASQPASHAGCARMTSWVWSHGAQLSCPGRGTAWDAAFADAEDAEDGVGGRLSTSAPARKPPRAVIARRRSSAASSGVMARRRAGAPGGAP